MKRTIQNIIEEVQQIFPNVGETQIIYDLNKIQDEFVRDTKCLLKVYSLGDLSTAIAWNLDNYGDFIGLKDIHFYDNNGKAMYIEEHDLFFELKDGVLIFYSKQGKPDLSVFDKILVEVFVKPSRLLDRTSIPDINDSYYEALLSKIMERYYVKFSKEPDKWTAVQYWAGEYARIRSYAQKERYIQGDYTLPEIVGYYDAKEVIYTKPNENPIQINGVSDVMLLTYKYYLELAYPAAHVEETGLFVVKKQLNCDFDISSGTLPGQFQIFSNNFDHLKTKIQYFGNGKWNDIEIENPNAVINFTYHSTPQTYVFNIVNTNLPTETLRFRLFEEIK